jgi:hypothetical protein
MATEVEFAPSNMVKTVRLPLPDCGSPDALYHMRIHNPKLGMLVVLDHHGDVLADLMCGALLEVVADGTCWKIKS